MTRRKGLELLKAAIHIIDNQNVNKPKGSFKTLLKPVLLYYLSAVYNLTALKFDGHHPAVLIRAICRLSWGGFWFLICSKGLMRDKNKEQLSLELGGGGACSKGSNGGHNPLNNPPTAGKGLVLLKASCVQEWENESQKADEGEDRSTYSLFRVLWDKMDLLTVGLILMNYASIITEVHYFFSFWYTTGYPAGRRQDINIVINKIHMQGIVGWRQQTGLRDGVKGIQAYLCPPSRHGIIAHYWVKRTYGV